MSRHDFYCWLDDEAESRQYHVRLTYELEGQDPGDWTTPPCSADIRIADLVILQARQFDADGELKVLEFRDTAKAYLDRAWSLVEESSSIRSRLEEELAAVERESSF